MPSSTSSSEAPPPEVARVTGSLPASPRAYLLWLAVSVVLLSAPSLLLGWDKPNALASMGVAKYQWIDQTLRDRGPWLKTVAVGSSKIWSAWLAVDVAEAHHGDRRSAANFGTQFVGRDRDYVLVREALRRSSLQRVVLEVSDAEVDAHHPSFPRLATMPELWRDAALSLSGASTAPEAREHLSSASRDLLSGLYFGYARELDRLLHGPAERDRAYFAEQDAHGGSRHSSEVMEARPWRLRTSAEVPPEGSRSVAYIDEIAATCKARRVDLVFLYVPSFGGPAMGDELRRYLGKRGKVVHFDDLEQLYQGHLWRDPDHLNTAGATLLTEHYIRSVGAP